MENISLEMYIIIGYEQILFLGTYCVFNKYGLKIIIGYLEL